MKTGVPINDGLKDITLHQWAPNRARNGATSQLLWFQAPNWTPHTVASNYYWGDWHEAVDVDGDGNIDIVATASDGNSTEYQKIIWYRNTGNATFQPIQVGINNGDGEISDFDIRDYDNDGKKDVLTRHSLKLIVYYQGANNTFSKGPAVALTTGNQAEGLGVLDINQDNYPDAVLEGFWMKNPGNRTANWTRTNFDPYWHTNEPSGYKGYAVKVAIGNIDGVGQPDIVISDSENTDQAIRWYPVSGNSVNTYKTVTSITNFNAHTLGTGDFDGDGDIDIMSAGLPRPTSQHFIFYNSNNGTNWDKVAIPGSGPGYSGKVADLNNDGRLDIVNSVGWEAQEIQDAGYTGPIRLQIMMNTNSNTGATPTPTPGSCQIQLNNWQTYTLNKLHSSKYLFVIPADIDGDGKKDIITGNGWWKNPGSVGGNWVAQAFGGNLNNAILVFDVDGDGDLDVVGTNGGGAGDTGAPNGNVIVWARNNGNAASFSIHTAATIGAANAYDFPQGAVNGDFGGGNQIAISWHQQNDSNQVNLLTIPSNPTTAWTVLNIGPSLHEDLSAGNIDGAGGLDLLQGTKWLRNNVTGFSQTTLSQVSGAPDRNNLADINRDGKLDAVIGFEAINIPGKLAWYAQTTPAGIWTENVISNNVVGPMSLDVADMNGDGDLDVVVGEHNYANAASARVLIFENQNNGTSWQQFQAGQGHEHHDGTQVADLDNDGDLDIASIGWTTNKILLYENKSNCNSSAPPPVTPTPTTNIPPTTPTVTPGVGSCTNKYRGDANCMTNPSGKAIDLLDYAIWYSEFIGGCSSTNMAGCGSNADSQGNAMDANFNFPGSTHFTTDNLVNIFDYAVWIQGYVSQETGSTPTPTGIQPTVTPTTTGVAPTATRTPTLTPTGNITVTPGVGARVLFDDVVQFVETDKGFHTIKAAGSNPLPGLINWKSPKDYFNGTWYFRYKITQADNNPLPGKLQVCIWNMPGYHPENCAPQIAHTGASGTTYTIFKSPADWYQKGNVPLDFTNSTPFLMRTVLRGANGCNVTQYNVPGSCWNQWNNFDTMRFKLTIVMVPQGETFAGWQAYP